MPAADRLWWHVLRPDKSVGKSVAEATSGVGQTVKEAMDDARKDIAQGNIKIRPTSSRVRRSRRMAAC